MAFALGVLFMSALLCGVAYIQTPRFGRLPEGGRLDSIQLSPHYANGEFHNQVATPMFAGGDSVLSVILSDGLSRPRGARPSAPLPWVNTNLKSLPPDQDLVVWLGHSTFFVQLAGQRILIDPVFDDHAGPTALSVQAFEGSSHYTSEDMPEIDALLITHDHWDHLNFESALALAPKVRRVVCPLGVGAYFEHWGYPRQKIQEGDWYTAFPLNKGLTIHVVPARHFSGRLLTRNKTLWAGFVLDDQQRRLYISGDTGFGPHFEEIAQRFGGFDLAALDMGQYDPRWPLIHMTPEQAAQAAQILKTRVLLPAHVGRFNLARHAWDEPFKRIVAASQGQTYQLKTPLIGEVLSLNDKVDEGPTPWWIADLPQ